eukprot:SAG31_NODE_15841_length_735_cov_18.426101_1_plen_65_part_00
MVKAGENLAPKKTTTIDVAYKPEPPPKDAGPDYEPPPPVVNAKLYVSAPDMPAWVFYLEGRTAE